MEHRYKKYENYHNRQSPVTGFSSPAKKRRQDFLKLLWRQNMLVFSVALLVFSILSQVLTPLLANRGADLSPQMRQLTGESRDDTTQYLKSQEGGGYSFEAEEQDSSGNVEHTGRNVDAYSATLPKDAKEGITVTEKSSQIAVTLTPKFITGSLAKADGDHLVYPTGPNKLVYTLKYNGLKEDIIVPKYIGNELSYKFELALPSGVEARLDERGSIGIYSSDPQLFGNISFGSDDDRQRIDKARENGDKNNLVMTIPYPVIKDASGEEYTDRAHFELSEKVQKQSEEAADTDLPAEVQDQMKTKTTKNTYTLNIVSQNLKELQYPIAIDPTMQITSSADFTNVHNDFGTEVDSTNNLIRRGSNTGGVLTWSTATRTLSSARRHPCMFMLNGYIYVVNGRTTTTSLVSTEYAPIDSDGNVTAAWSSTTTVSGGLNGTCGGATSYGNYLYIIGASVSTHTKQKSDGSLESWSSTSSFGGVNNVNHSQRTYAHSGYLYVLGGVDSDASNVSRANVSYAPINANGSLGTFANTSSMVTAAHMGIIGVHNNYIYWAGGYQNSGSSDGQTMVQRASINSNGTLNTWISQAAVLTTNEHWHGSGGIYNGYLYVAGGGDPVDITEYMPIYADGSVGTSRTTTDMPSPVFDNSGNGIFYKGKLYAAGGCSTGTGNCADGDTHLNTIYYATISPAGTTHTGTTEANTFTTARHGHGTIVAHGYIYVLGGCTVDQGSCDTNAETLGSTYYAPLNSNGSVGSFTAGTSFPTISSNAQTRGVTSATVVNDYIYVMGGSGNCGSLGAYQAACANVFYASINTGTGALSAWTNSGNPLPEGRRRGTAASYNGIIYYIGGRNPSNSIVGTVYYAGGGTGANGTWNTTSSLLNARELLAATAYAGYMYVGSGYDGSSTPEEIEYAEINSNGTLDTFANTSSIGTGRDGATIVAHNGYLYVAGGFSDQTIIEFAEINSDGTLDSFVTSANGLTTAGRRYAGAGGTHNGILYIAGGNNSGGLLNSVESIPINNGGASNSSWTTDSTPFPGSRWYHQVVAYNGYIYTMGGCFVANCDVTGAQTGGVQYAPIGNDGEIGTWNSTSGFAERQTFGATALNGYMYVMGGTYRSGVFNDLITRNDTLYAEINSDGTLDAFQSTTSSSRSLVVNDGTSTLYATNDANSIAYAKPNTNGTITSWTAVSNAPQTSTYHSGLVVYRNFIYKVGGCASGQLCDATNTKREVEYAPISPTTGDTTAAWKYTRALPMPRYLVDGKAFAQNGYIIAHPDGSPVGSGDALYYAAVLPSGELGDWQRGVDAPATGAANGSTIYNGRIYRSGGQNAGSPTAATYYSTLRFIPRVGSLSKRYDFDTSVTPTKFITRGTKQNGAVVSATYSNNFTCNNTAYDNSNTVSNLGYTGANVQNITLGRTQARCLFLRYTIDDTQSAVFPDSGNETTITDFDVYFDPNPGRRLRGGRTFINGADRGLDAAP